ncbi:MAG: tetratricopeptide (TPR) repeat protein [Kiritimatiellia bacterium]|jgi:tetratricopeptide (TPR) repeat protein
MGAPTNTGGPLGRSKTPVGIRLQALDRGQLVEVIQRLLKSAPDLNDLVFLPVSGEQNAVDAHRIRVQVAGILSNMGDDWRASSRAEQDLWPLVAIGTQYLERGALTDARTVFNTIITTTLAYYEQLRDEESEIAGIVVDCVNGLAKCLDRLTEASDREPLLRDIFTVYSWDTLGNGGYGMDSAPSKVLLEQTRVEERARVAAWVREDLPEGHDKFKRSQRQAGGRFILKLLGSETLPELEALYSQADLVKPHLDLLLKQGREDEAINLLRRAPGRSLVSMAEALIAAGLTAPAIATVRDHAIVLHTDGDHARRWLRAHGVDLPASVDNLVWTIQRFKGNHTIGGYKKIREGAKAVDRWPQALELVGELDPDRTRLQPIRARMFADLGKVDEALEELRKLIDSGWRSCAADIAETFEATNPAIAIELYKRLADEREAHGTRAARKRAALFRERIAHLGGSDE